MGDLVKHLNTPVRRWLRTRSDRCPGCGFHVGTMGHDRECLFGPRAWFTLTADGQWVHNPT